MITVTYPLKNTDLLPETTAKLIEELYEKTRSENDRVEVLCDYCDSVYHVVGDMAEEAAKRQHNCYGDVITCYGCAGVFALLMLSLWCVGATGAWWGLLLFIAVFAGMGTWKLRQSYVHEHYAHQLEKIHKAIPHKF